VHFLSLERISLRNVLIILAIVLLAGCGTTASGSGNPTSARQTHWSKPPPMTINPAHRYVATLATSDGIITVQLLPRVAPIAVNSFVFLARHRYFDGIIFHRIVKGFVIQTGDPTGTGFGGPGYHFKDEKVTLKYTPGTVAMANSGSNSNGSQFFIVTGPAAASQLKPLYTIFGRVTAGMNTVHKLENTPVQPNPGNGELSSPAHDVYLKRVTITESK
jgi:cyclophilin family peptidyl-prolyl cis-trans isomerase